MRLSSRTIYPCAVLLALASLTVSSEEGGATQIRRRQIMREIVDQCGYIVAGTVTRSVVVRDSVGWVATRFTLRDLEFAKGATAGDSLVVTTSGGSYGGYVTVVSDQAQLDKGERYVCFLASHGTQGLYAGTSYFLWGQSGAYHVFRDRARSQSIVVDVVGRFVTGVDTLRISRSKLRLPDGYRRHPAARRDSIISDGAAQARAAHEAPISEAEFLAGLRRVVEAFGVSASNQPPLSPERSMW